jgi:hypothetical protein
VKSKDPLGLFNPGHEGGAKHHIPKHKTSALFAALFVRAPFDVLAKIYEISPEQDPDDLAIALSVIPSEEEARLMSQPQKRIPYRSRAWTLEEYDCLLNLLVKHWINNPPYSSTSPFLTKCASWILPFPLTPLSIAAYNPDVTNKVLLSICELEPKARTIECKLFGVQTTPLFIAAASPVPPKPFNPNPIMSVRVRYEESKENRWRKVKLLAIGSEWYMGGHSSREPTIEEIHTACKEAIRRQEWELVREFLKRQDEAMPVVQAQLEKTTFQGDGMDLDIKVSSTIAIAEPAQPKPSTPSSLLDPIRAALSEHDVKTQTRLQKQQKANEKARARDDWHHKNMGLVMYPIDAAVDLVHAIIPSSWLKRKNSGDGELHGIVSAMS